MFKKAVHKCEKGGLISLLLTRKVRLEMQNNCAQTSRSIQLEVLQWPFDDLWLFPVHKRRQKDVDFGARWRGPFRGF